VDHLTKKIGKEVALLVQIEELDILKVFGKPFEGLE
jgi:hypothetical protein